MSISALGNSQKNSALTLLREGASNFDRPRQRRHEIWILTCYVNFDCIKRLIKELRQIVRLTDVYLAFDLSEVFRMGPAIADRQLKEICSWCEAQDINFEVRALSSPTLVHSKGYAIIQRLDEQISDGLTLITSANFTNAGFFGSRNIEIGYLSRKKTDVRAFQEMYNSLWEKYGKDIAEDAEADSEYLYKYSLLASGVFLHKWDGSLSQMIGLRYRLTDLAKEQSSFNPELIELGMEPGDTFTRQALRLQEFPGKSIPVAFTKAFTIETHWGRWCPNEIWTELCDRIADAGDFLADFAAMTTDDILEEASVGAKEVQERLTNRRLIKAVPSDFIENWCARVRDLRSNERRLFRLFTGYEEHALPYDAGNHEEIEELFASIAESIQLSRKKNALMWKTIASMETRTLRPLKLTKAERLQIQAMLSDASQVTRIN